MSYQSSVFQFQASGVQGEIYSDYPVGSDAYVINSASAANNIFGNACSIVTTTQGQVKMGNSDGAPFAGFLIFPKAQASFGTSGQPLAPTLAVPNGTVVDVLNLGMIWVFLPAAAAIGDLVIYDNVTGALSTITPTTTLPSGKSFANATVQIYPVTQAGLAVIRVTTVPVPPAP